MKKLLHIFAFVVSLSCAESCVPVMGEWITAADIGRIDPAFLALEPDTRMLRTPRPGTQRHLAPGELAMLAAKRNIAAGESRRACFEYPFEALSEARIRQGVQDALEAAGLITGGSGGASISILEWPREPLPAGRLSFNLRRVRPPAEGGGTWLYGEIKFLKVRTVPVWVRVRIETHADVVVAMGDWPSGTVLRPDHARRDVRLVDLLPVRARATKFVSRFNEAMGQQLTSDWKSGAALTEEQIKPATQIRKGDPVALEVINGGARLRVQAKAEGSAALGSPVVLKIDGSARRIVAKVTGPQMTQLRLER